MSVRIAPYVTAAVTEPALRNSVETLLKTLFKEHVPKDASASSFIDFMIDLESIIHSVIEAETTEKKVEIERRKEKSKINRLNSERGALKVPAEALNSLVAMHEVNKEKKILKNIVLDSSAFLLFGSSELHRSFKHSRCLASC